MLKLTLITVGDKMPAWVNQGYQDYAKRISGNAQLQLIEIPSIKRGKNADISRIQAKETTLVLQKLPTHAHVICLDLRGKTPTTLDIANHFKTWLQEGREVCFLIGGPEGFEEEILKASHETWKLSALTFPHPLVRIILAEQLYRAWSILQGSPYHR